MSLPYSYREETIWTTEDCEFFFTDIQTLCEWYSQPENHLEGDDVASTDFRYDDPMQYRDKFDIWFTTPILDGVEGDDEQEKEFSVTVKCHYLKLIQRKG